MNTQDTTGDATPFPPPDPIADRPVGDGGGGDARLDDRDFAGEERRTTSPSDPTIIGVSFTKSFSSQEFLIAMTRLKADAALDLEDAVVVIKDDDGDTKVIETVDPSVRGAALSGALWTGLLGLLLGGPVGWLAGLGVGAGAGAVTAKVIDLGIPDDWVDWFRQAVRPGTHTVVLLAKDIDVPAFEAEARRFAPAEVVYSTLPNDTLAELREAFGSH